MCLHGFQNPGGVEGLMLSEFSDTAVEPSEVLTCEGFSGVGMGVIILNFHTLSP